MKPKTGLHYCDINDSDKAVVGALLAQHKIICYPSCYYHDGGFKLHEEKFTIYKNMVKTCILEAVGNHKELDIVIAGQGGVQRYGPDFLAELRRIPDECGPYCKIRLALETNAHPGIQLADFYAGAIRDFLLSQLVQKRGLARPYELLAAQIQEIVVEPGTLNRPY